MGLAARHPRFVPAPTAAWLRPLTFALLLAVGAAALAQPDQASGQQPAAHVTSMDFTSENAEGEQTGLYVAGDPIDVTLRFSATVTVTGSPRVQIKVGGQEPYAVYESGSGTDALVFRYIIGSGFPNSGFPIILSREIDLHNGAALSSAGVAVDLRLPPAITGIVYVAPPSINQILPGGLYEHRLTYSEPVAVAGRPYLTLKIPAGDIGLDPVRAHYVSGSGTDTLVFEYVIPAGYPHANGPTGLQHRVASPSGASITRIADPPVPAYDRLHGRVSWFELILGEPTSLALGPFATWPARRDDGRLITPSMELVFSTSPPSILEFSPPQLNRTYAEHQQAVSTPFQVTPLALPEDPGAAVALRLTIQRAHVQVA